MCILVQQYKHSYIEIMLLMSLMNCINAPTICYQISLLLRVALYRIDLIPVLLQTMIVIFPKSLDYFVEITYKVILSRKF